MLHFLSAEVIYGLLLVTTFASVGLLGLWAATSRWHPFLRTTIVLAILSILLLRPMFEPFVMLVSQVATIAAGVAIYRKWKNRKQTAATDARKTRYQFSLRTLLFVSTLVAMGAAVWAKTPELGWHAWLGYMAVGIAAGVVTLCTTLVASPRAKWWFRLVGFLGAITFTILGLEPAIRAYENYVYHFYNLDNTSLILAMKLAAIPLIAQLTIIILWRQQARDAAWRSPSLRFVTHSICLILLLSVLVLPSYFTWRLLNPLPPPPLNRMSPNAYNDLVALGKKLSNSSLIAAFSADPVDMKRLAQEVANHATTYQRLDDLLDQPSAIPDPLNSWNESLTERRELARALAARADVAREAGDFDNSLQASVQNLRLAHAFHGGLLVDYLVSVAIEGIGLNGIYSVSEHLDGNSCQTVIDALLAHDQSRESFDKIVYCERQWSHNAEGWWGHLCAIVDDSRSENHTVSSYSALLRSRALSNLMMTELALRKHQLTHNTLPDRLDQLVPDILPEVPRDPFDLAGGLMRYKKTPDGYILYSVGQNGADDGGVAPASIQNSPNDLERWWQDEHRDLRLKHFFAE